MDVALRLELPDGFAEISDSEMFPSPPPNGEVRFLLAAHENGSEIEATLAPYVPLAQENFTDFAAHFTERAPVIFRNLTIDGSRTVVEHGTHVLVALYRTNYGPYAGALIFRSFAGRAMRVTLQGPSTLDPELSVRTLDALVQNVAKIRDPAA